MKRIVQYMVIAVCVPMSLMISIATLYSHDVQVSDDLRCIPTRRDANNSHGKNKTNMCCE